MHTRECGRCGKAFDSDEGGGQIDFRRAHENERQERHGLADHLRNDAWFCALHVGCAREFSQTHTLSRALVCWDAISQGDEWRDVEGRDALAPGVRVQLSWIKYARYCTSADVTVKDRLAVVLSQEGSTWIVEDSGGERHRLQDAHLAETEPDPSKGRWRIAGPIPLYSFGERLLLHWRYRSPSKTPRPPRDDCWATVTEERHDTVCARLDDGSEIVLHRFGAQADEPSRRAPRWFVIARGQSEV